MGEERSKFADGGASIFLKHWIVAIGSADEMLA